MVNYIENCQILRIVKFGLGLLSSSGRNVRLFESVDDI